MVFPCIKCGLCCKMLQHIPILTDYDIGNGACRYLENNLCSIYEDRPLICNIEEMYFLYFKGKMTEKEFVDINIKSCTLIVEYFKGKPIIEKKK